MVKMSDAFPGKYLKAADLSGTQPTYTIASYTQEPMQDGAQKWVLFFEEEQKGLVLNVTNANVCAGLYGDDLDDWIGNRVSLFTVPVNFNGRVTDSIRLRSAPKKKAPPPRVTPADIGGDDIPDA
jgi:hypothetical protein